MIWPTAVEYRGGHRLRVTFNNGVSSEIDFYLILRADHRRVFQELLSLEEFQRFSVDMDTVVWENGADLAPEYLYDLVVVEETKSVR